MAHPFNEHRSHSKSRSRVGHIMKSGGHAHSDAAADKKLIKQMIAQHERKEHDAPGHAHGGRLNKYARGGAAKKHHTQVNIAVVAPGGRHDQAGAAPGGPSAPVPHPPIGAAPPGGPSPALPPGMPPAGGPPGLMPRPPMKRGGRVKMTAGAESGEGRLQKVRAYGKRARKK